MSYISEILKDRDKKVALGVKALKDKEFDSIIVRGVSGMIIGTSLALKLKKNLVIIRKEKSIHSGQEVEFAIQPKKCVFVDDLVCSGETFREVKSKLDELIGICPRPIIIGVYLENPVQSNEWQKTISGKILFIIQQEKKNNRYVNTICYEK
ncbi:MAG: hypothetical protein AABY07_00850 [Nanoarchaeota archaeon]